MEVSQVILDYMRVLVWPTVLVVALLLFRGSVRALLGRIATQSEEISATAFGIGVSAKLRQVAELAEKSDEGNPDDLKESVLVATRDLGIEEFRRVSSYFVSAPQPVRAQAAREIAGLAPLLTLDEVLDFAGSPYAGERVGAAIALGVCAADSIQARQDPRMVSVLRQLLADHYSRVRYRAVEAVKDRLELIEALEPELLQLADTDANGDVRSLARKVIRQLLVHCVMRKETPAKPRSNFTVPRGQG
jgi:hypothetical protein